MNINKISFGQLKTSSNHALLKEALYNYVETDKVENEHQYKIIQKNNISFIDAQPKTEQEIFLNLLTKGIKIERVKNPISFEGIKVNLKDEDDEEILKEVLADYDISKNPEEDFEYKMMKSGNSRIISSPSLSTENEIIRQLEEQQIDVKQVFLKTFNKNEMQEAEEQSIKASSKDEMTFDSNFLD